MKSIEQQDREYHEKNGSKNIQLPLKVFIRGRAFFPVRSERLKFVGRGSEQLEDFCCNEKINNITLIGRFEMAELPQFYMETDIAVNVYGNRDQYLYYALSNKLYSTAMMRMPILVSPDTYIEKISRTYSVGRCVI